ncbi:hypothetical protein P8V03_18810 [Clostridium sp. A1-XYC3]|uniref:Uncharacterized protein n=1 Tax=Clostridium tanneri TaxID=3037988 RepID=A0ABU4JYC6_9CLOT|nr:hypothetical protein [Clostridium sp. A1-XYC3]MDW8803182.1 hypothetical protein [Clostridium sp. A1-XYC3]
MKEFTVPREKFIASFSNRVLKTRNYKKIIFEILKAVKRSFGGDLIEE